MEKNVLLTGHAGFYNRGCEAIVRCTAEIIKKNHNDCQIKLISHDFKSDMIIFEKEDILIDEVISAQSSGAKKYSISWMLQTINRRLFYKSINFYDYLIRKSFKRSNIVISVGGDNFTSDYGSPKRFFDQIKLARHYGAKTIIWGASIGPFINEIEEKLWMAELRKVDLITVREDKTYAYLHKFGVEKNVFRVSDPAFLLKERKPKKIELPFDESKNRIRVGVGMSDLLASHSNTKISSTYISAFVDFCNFIIDTYNAEIIFIPHVTKLARYINDYDANLKVASKVKDVNRCFIAPDILGAREMKHCISQCDYFIGARTHSTIASFSMNIPTISIGYSVKAWGINQDVLGNDEYVININNVNLDVLINKFKKLYENTQSIKNTLQHKIPIVKKRAQEAESLLLKVFNE